MQPVLREFDVHVNRHLQRHLDEYAPRIPEKKTPWEAFGNIPEGMNRDLLKVFEKYNLGDKHEQRFIEVMTIGSTNIFLSNPYFVKLGLIGLFINSLLSSVIPIPTELTI